ncbi:M48 family metallopeptidase [Acidobacteria bacterium AB60]|nr:M48 family metallopeptidase [Acidobacteria bacterium AB60]
MPCRRFTPADGARRTTLMRLLRICAAAICGVFLLAVWQRPAMGQAAVPAATAGDEAGKQPPQSDQAYHLPPDKLAKAITLNKIRLALEIAGTLWGLAVLWLLLATRTAAGAEAWVQRVTRLRWVQGLLFFALFFVVSAAASLPLDAIGHAVSRHYAISVQGWGGWLGDQGKSLALSVIFGSLILLLFSWIVRVSPRAYWVWLWAIAVPLACAAIVVTPVVIDPLFNKFEPLSKTHAELVGKLEKVVARTGTDIPPERMFLMKASEKSNGLNAYVTGMGATKRFVMWDTATDRLPDDEVMFVFGHESGHYVLNHIPKMLSIMAVALFFVFWGSARFAEWMVGRFGARWEIETVGSRAGFLTLIFALSIVGFFLTPAGNTMSRHFEHEADVYGQEAIHGLVPDPQKTAISGFNHLGEAWLDDPDPNPIVEFWDYNHPSVKNRANFAAHYDPWANGGHGEFFAQ